MRMAYREAPSDAIASLKRRLASEIRENGPIGFDRYMAAALYDTEGGYYSSPSGQVGKEGDFFTSVSAGPVFGHLVARYMLNAWEKMGKPDKWRILELGAHDGQLASDILSMLPKDIGAEYTIIEPLDQLAEAQQNRLGGQIKIVRNASELDPLPSVLIANELLDALPCQIVESTGDRWIEIGVGLDNAGHFKFTAIGPADEITSHLPMRPAGYRTEVRQNYSEILAPLTKVITPGRMLLFDYGFEREDYYAELRTEGTLRTFLKHKAGSDPLENPGQLDITAHVDFTAVREAAESLGGNILGFENQSRFLTRVASPWLISLEGKTDAKTMKEVRNFQTLTHPGQLGSRFHVMEIAFS